MELSEKVSEVREKLTALQEKQTGLGTEPDVEAAKAMLEEFNELTTLVSGAKTYAQSLMAPGGKGISRPVLAVRMTKLAPSTQALEQLLKEASKARQQAAGAVQKAESKVVLDELLK